MVSGVDMTRYFAGGTGGSALENAFSRRSAVLPFRGKRRVPAADMPMIWERLMTGANPPNKRLVYIHIPFCANHCLFCGFYRNAHVPATSADYVARLVDEIRSEAENTALRTMPVHAVYIGGGTPTALRAEELSHIIATVRRVLPLAADCEITVEGRIIHFGHEKIDACLEAGANRFSIGVQSFDTDVRRRQGRRCDRKQVISFLEDLRERDRATLVIDLMYGLPDQSLEIWRQDVTTATAIAPDGIDLYGLNLIPGTPLFTAIAAGKFSATPDLSKIGAFYQLGANVLHRANWRQISNNHWGRTTRERNRYNLLIKEGADCIAFGAGAGGSIGTIGYGLTGDLRQYADDLRCGRKPFSMMTVADDHQPVRNFVTAAFEIGYLDMNHLDELAGCETAPLFGPLLAQWQRAGLLSFADNTIELTLAGRFWYANLISAFHEILENRLVSTVDAA